MPNINAIEIELIQKYTPPLIIKIPSSKGTSAKKTIKKEKASPEQKALA